MIVAKCKQCGESFNATRGMHGLCSTACRFWSKVQKTDGCWLWTGYLNAGGYGRVYVSPGRQVYAHRWAHEDRYGPMPAEAIACHRCNVRACVRPDHVYVGTHATNAADALAAGSTRRGEALENARLTDALVVRLRDRFRSGETARALAEEIGACFGTVLSAVRGWTWKHVPGAVSFDEIPKGRAACGERAGTSKLTEEAVRTIRSESERGVRRIDLARRFGVDASVVTDVVLRHTWKHVQQEATCQQLSR